MTISIRYARPDDAPIIHRFIYELADFQKLAQLVELTPEVLRLQLEGQDPPFECLLAEEEDKPAGFALFYSTYSTFTGAQGMYLVDLYVSPSFRRSGVGRLMFAKLLDIARARKYARIDWEVLKGNSQAEDFYRSLQARRLDQWTCWRLEPGRLKAEETAFVTGPCSIAQCSS